MNAEITEREFKLFQSLIYRETGISLHDKKATMVQARLSKRLRELGMNSFTKYYEFLDDGRNAEELLRLLSAISTNVTSFFREGAQWDFLEGYLGNLHVTNPGKKLRIWSAASSTGQEPYSIAMFLNEHLQNIREWNIKLLATDIDTKVLAHAMRGIYSEKDIGAMPKVFLNRYFVKVKTDNGMEYQIIEPLRKMILYRMFNLVRGDFSMFKEKTFDIIFCRNVMIYFDGPTREELVKRFHSLLKPGGLLLLGHSESLTRQNSEFKLVQSAIYKKI